MCRRTLCLLADNHLLKIFPDIKLMLPPTAMSATFIALRGNLLIIVSETRRMTRRLVGGEMRKRPGGDVLQLFALYAVNCSWQFGNEMLK
jgi:hypothetical protein